ncbi:MAG: hypothetical protein QF473_16595, partial [Planctomycetota bacterium]|nr:hypothetical protein [Planctomycetota bacterium]
MLSFRGRKFFILFNRSERDVQIRTDWEISCHYGQAKLTGFILLSAAVSLLSHVQAEVVFQSDLSLLVWMKASDGEVRKLGETPSRGNGIRIPKENLWFIQPKNQRLLDDDLREIASQMSKKSIPGLSLAFCTRITDEGLSHLSASTSLKLLSLENLRISDRGLSHLMGLRGLNHLSLRNCRKVTDVGLSRLKALTHLQTLDLGRTRVGDSTLALLKVFTNLAELSLTYTKASDTGLKELGSLKVLNRLDLSLTHISDNGLSYLAASRHLRELSLAGCKQITDAGLVHLKDLKNLETLKLGYTDLNGSGFVYLKSLKKLAYLDLSHTKVRSEGLQHLSGMTQL